MRWMREHKLFSTIAGIVLILVIFVVGTYLKGGGTNFLSSIISKGVTSITNPIFNVSRNISTDIDGFINKKDLQEENEKLKKENAILKQNNISLTLKKYEYKELKELYKVFDFDALESKENAIGANVTAINFANSENVFTIDIGKEKGIKKGNVVVSGDGLVGKIEDIGKGWSKVISITDSVHKVSFIVKRKPKIAGVVKGDNSGLRGYLINERSRIVKGDTLITSGIGNYPKGIIIGTVYDVNFDSDTQLKVISVKSPVEFKELRKVVVFK